MIRALNLDRRYNDTKEEYISYLDDIMERQVPCNGYYTSLVEDSLQNITNYLNGWLEKMIKNNPNQWIWTHNRWK